MAGSPPVPGLCLPDRGVPRHAFPLRCPGASQSLTQQPVSIHCRRGAGLRPGRLNMPLQATRNRIKAAGPRLKTVEYPMRASPSQGAAAFAGVGICAPSPATLPSKA